MYAMFYFLLGNEINAYLKWTKVIFSQVKWYRINSYKWLIGFEPGHEKMCLMSYTNNKGADQPAHPRSLISAFIVRCLDSIISLDSIAEISRL